MTQLIKSYTSRTKYRITKTPIKLLNLTTSPSTHYKQESNTSDIFIRLQQNSERNSTSLNYTHHNYLHTQTDKSKVMKLALWDKEHITYQKKDTKMLYQSLSTFYKTNPQFSSKEKEINKYYTLLEKQSKYRNFLKEAALKADNKILKNFINNGKKKEGTILYNSISKTKTRFDFSLFNEKNQKDFQSDLNIDVGTLNTIKNGDLTTDYYRKIIREKNQQEQLSKDEIMTITRKVFEKKCNRVLLENKLSELYKQKSYDTTVFNEKKNKIKMQMLNFQQKYDVVQKQFNKLNHMTQLKQRTKAAVESNHLEEKFKQIVNEYESKIASFITQKEQLLKELDLARKEENYFKKISHEFLKEQQRYFLDILKKGYDVRNEGLVWVVRNLLELDTNLEYHHFPKFLNHQQCDYLLQMADISLEEIQLKIVLKAVKGKQRKIKTAESVAQFNKIMDYVGNKNDDESEDDDNENNFKFKPKKEKCIKEKLFVMFNNIYEKYEDAFKNRSEKRLEEIKLEKVQKQIKDILVDNGNHKGNKKINEILSYLQQNEQNRDFLEIILNIRARLDYLKKLREKIKNEQLISFKISNHVYQRFLNAKHSLQHDLIFSALFGCNIQV